MVRLQWRGMRFTARITVRFGGYNAEVCDLRPPPRFAVRGLGGYNEKRRREPRTAGGTPQTANVFTISRFAARHTKSGPLLGNEKIIYFAAPPAVWPSKYFKSWFKIVFWAQKCRKIVLFTEFSAASIHIKFLVISKNKRAEQKFGKNSSRRLGPIFKQWRCCFLARQNDWRIKLWTLNMNLF